MDAARIVALAKVVRAACDELLHALEQPEPARPASLAPAARAILGWQTENRIAFLRQWYPTYAASSLIFRAVRAMDGVAPGSDAVMTTYAIQRLQLKRPADIQSNRVAVVRASQELCEAVGWDALTADTAASVAVHRRVPEPPSARPPAARADPGAAIWHPWATIKELARRDGVILDGLDDLPGYNKRREARGLAPLYLKTFKMGGL